MNKREYAASLGLAVAGARGRLSREAHAAIDKAEAEGTVFDDPVKPVINTPQSPKPVRQRAVVVHDAGIAGDVLTKWPDDQIFIGTDSNGKTHKVNARQVCMHSGYSMTSCPCGQDHKVLVPSMEHIIVKPKGG